MHATLVGTFQPTFISGPNKQSSLLSTLPAKAPKIDLFEISAVVYKLLSKKKDHAAFIVSLNKLNFLLLEC